MAADAPAPAPVPAPIRELYHLFRLGTVNGLSESQLLERFLGSRDDRAFEALVSRHGPMVLRTCRSLLDDPLDAEDAFQATFLVLARRAGSIRNPDLLGPWLHRVARRVSSRANVASSRRRRRERPASESLDAAPAPDRRPHPDRLAIHQAIDRLPRAYRLVVILCDLEGRSHSEAASLLGWPLGTVKGRQSRARSLLRRRLGRLGLAPATVSTLLLPSPLDAALLSPALVSRTARSAAAFAAGGALAAGTVPGGVLSLASGALTGMFFHQVKFVALAGLLAMGTVGTGLGALKPTQDAGVVGGVLDPSSAPGTPTSPPLGSGTAPATPEEPKSGIESLVGAWRLVSMNGSPVSQGTHRLDIADVRGPRIGSKFSISCTTSSGTTSFFPNEEGLTIDMGGGRMTRYAIVDPGASPPTWDYRSFAISEAADPISNRGIYHLEGETLALHVATPDNPRPTDFTRIWPKANLYKYQRIREEPPQAAGGVAGVVPDPGRTPETPSHSPPGTTSVMPPAVPLLGTWARVSVGGSSGENLVPITLQLTRADQWLAGNLPGDGVVLAIRFASDNDGVVASPGDLAWVDPETGRFDFYAYEQSKPDEDTLRQTWRGIHHLEGDRLTIHRFRNAGPASEEFEPGPGSVVETYRRIDPDQPSDPVREAGAIPDPSRTPEAPSSPPPSSVTTPASPPASEEVDAGPITPILGTWRRTSMNHMPTPEGMVAMLDIRQADPEKLSGNGTPVLCTGFAGPLPGGGFLNSQCLAMVLGDGNSGHFDFLSLSVFGHSDDEAPMSPSNPAIYRIEGNTLTLLSAPDRPTRFDQELTPDVKLEVYERTSDPLPNPTSTQAPGHSYGFPPGAVPGDRAAGVGDGPSRTPETTSLPRSESATTPAAPSPTELDGRWIVANTSPTPLDQDEDGGDFRFARGMVLDISGGRISPPGLEWGEIAFRLDPEADPKQIDVTYDDVSMWGPRWYDPKPPGVESLPQIEPVTRLGIYQLEDPERLSLRFAAPGAPRPTEPRAALSPGDRSLILQRLPGIPEPAETEPVSPSHPTIDRLIGHWRCVATGGLPGYDEVDLTMEIEPTDGPITRPQYRDEVSLRVSSRNTRRLPGADGSRSIISWSSLAFVAPASDPVRVDFLATAQPTESEFPLFQSRGILRVEGDTLMLHLAPFESDTRPSGFDRDPIGDTRLLIYQRFDPETPSPPGVGMAGDGDSPSDAGDGDSTSQPPPGPNPANPFQSPDPSHLERYQQELEQRRHSLVTEAAELRPKADLLAIKVESLATHYRDALTEQLSRELPFQDRDDITPDDRNQAEKLNQTVVDLRNALLEQSRELEVLRLQGRSIDSNLDQLDRLRSEVARAISPVPRPPTDRLDAIEAKLDRLLDLLPATRLP